MNQLILTFCIFLFSAVPLLCQVDSSFLNLYYESNQYRLLESHQAELDFFLEKTPPKSIQNIILFGHTDSDASDEYNLTLSKNRVDGVYQYLVKKGFASILLQKKHFGEFEPVATNENEFGKRKNRRVELVVIQKKKKRTTVFLENPPTEKKKATPIEKEVVQLKKEKPNPCQKDTTLTLEDGVTVVMNQCEFEEKKDCIKFEILNNVDTLKSRGISNFTTDGIPLVTCGMFSVSVSGGCEPCFDTPIKVRFPITNNCSSTSFTSNPGVYNLKNGNWELSPKEKIKRKTIQKIRYNEITFTCNGAKNCDWKVKCQSNSKIKIKGKRKLLSANILTNCPVGNYPLQLKTKKTAKGKAPFFSSNGLISVLAMDKNGDTISIQESLGQLKKLKLIEGKNYCKTKPNLKLLHFPLVKNTNTSFSSSEGKSVFDNHWITGSAFTSLEYIFPEKELYENFSYEFGAGIYRHFANGNIVLENRVVELENGIQQIGLSGTAGINSPYFWKKCTATLFTQFGFGTNFAKLQSSETIDIIDQKALNGWGFTSNWGITLESPLFWKHWKVSIGETYNITFTKLSEFKTFEPVLANAEKNHRIKFIATTRTLMTTLALKYYF